MFCNVVGCTMVSYRFTLKELEEHVLLLTKVFADAVEDVIILQKICHYSRKTLLQKDARFYALENHETKKTSVMVFLQRFHNFVLKMKSSSYYDTKVKEIS